MKSIAADSASSCLVWFLVFGVLSLCLCPTAIVIGAINTTVQADFVARTLEPYLCPANSTAEITTFESTTRDTYGNETPATAYEMRCVDDRGAVVKAPGPEYAFYWVGGLVVASLILAGVLALLLAIPLGGFIMRWVNRARGAS